MTAMRKAMIALVTVLIVFLLGFVPQYLEKRRIQSQLDVATERLQLSELRDLAGMMLLEGLRQNFGTARDYSSQYFEKLRETAEQVEDSTLKMSLDELLSSRDQLTAALSKADPGSASQLQAIFAKTQMATKAQP
jgi:hypothetical protein